MDAKRWTRREFVYGCTGTSALIASGAVWAQGASLPFKNGIEVSFRTTTEAAPWQNGRFFEADPGGTSLDLRLEPDAQSPPAARIIQGFGACFNELGWTALNALPADARQSVLRELFHPTEGMRFTYCRTPIGANDFSLGPYSYDDTEGDFELKDFSVAHDLKTLIPFIHAAQSFQPGLRLWASPWTPPSWMKRNGSYSGDRARRGPGDKSIQPDLSSEGQDLFRVEPRYLESYARYFGKYVEAYGRLGIPISMVMPQNEFNSAQPFPSCTWSAAGLTSFLHYLGPEMARRKVEIFFGTLERSKVELLETAMSDEKAGPFIKGVGVQWAGKNALSTIARRYPALAVLGSEQECGDGNNNWAYTSYCWQLMKTYFRNGANAYMYWNIALSQGSPSTWGWKQNSLVSVDTKAGTFRYTHDFYLLKHLAHFVDVGAHRLDTSGTCDDALAFRNSDGTVVLLLRNELARVCRVTVRYGDRHIFLELPADSISTISLKA